MKTFGVYLDVAQVLLHTTSDAVLVKCHSADFRYEFHLWKGLSRGYVAKCCLTRASMASLPSTGTPSTDEFPRSSGAASYAEGDVLLSTLRTVFGFTDFKPGQREVIDTILFDCFRGFLTVELLRCWGQERLTWRQLRENPFAGHDLWFNKLKNIASYELRMYHLTYDNHVQRFFTLICGMSY